MRIFFTFCFTFLSVHLIAQTFQLKGKILDQNNRPVSFASVYIKNSTSGTSANSEGEYRLSLKTGDYELVFKAIGYKSVTKSISIQGDQLLTISLTAESYQLKDVVVSAGKEDPAYEIIRQAIRKRKKYLTEVKAYSTEVYIKGLQKLLEAPKKFLGANIDDIGKEIGLDSNRRGIIYLSESESKYTFKAPGQVHEEMISSKVSGSNKVFSLNRASDMEVNFYQNILDWHELSNRPLISPISDNAFLYYRYKYLGSVNENGEIVNKIEVIPKRQHDPAFSGNIYIIEDSWRIYGLDLKLTKDANINFVDTLNINQQYFPVNKNIWMPATTKLAFNGKVFGFKFGGYFVSVYKNYNLNPQLGKKEFNEVVKVTAEAGKKDSAYWMQARPIPLTNEEKADYGKKEVLAKKRESKAYLDSLDKANNKFKLLDFIFTSGYTIRNRFRKETFHVNSLLNSVSYNTVEGFAVNYEAGYTKLIDTVNNRYLSLTGKVRYGFSNKLFSASMSGNFPVGKTSVRVNFGSDVIDMNNQEPIIPLINSLYSLFAEKNYEKLYRSQFGSITASRRLAGGLILSAGMEYADRKWLPNSSDYKFHDVDSREFTSNNPFTPDVDQSLFPQNQSFKLQGRLTYNFSNKYSTYPTGRYYLPSKWPVLGLSYSRSFTNVFGSDTQFGLLSADISKSNIPLGMYGNFSFYAAAGKFVNNDNSYFIDYKHFNGNQVAFCTAGPNKFLLLDYYNYSTGSKYFEAHAEQNFSGFFLNKIPLIRKLKLQELAGFNYLATPALRNYSEMTIGIKYMAFRAMYAWSFNTGDNMRQGLRFSVGF